MKRHLLSLTMFVVAMAGCGNRPSSPKSDLPWVRDLSQAMKAAEPQGKIILADFSAKW